MNMRHRVLVAGVVVLCAIARAGFAQERSACDPAASRECADAKAVGAAVEKALQTANETGLSGLRLQKAVLTLETKANVKNGFVLN